MSRFFKILIILLAMFPMWATLIAFAADEKTTEVTSEDWRNKINSRLLKLEDQRLQITEILPYSSLPAAEYFEREFDLDLSQISLRGTSRIGLRFRDEKGRLENITELSAHVFSEIRVPVALRPIRSGELIRDADIQMRWMEATQAGSSPAKKEALIGSQAKSFLSAETVIQTSQVAPPQLVRRGDRIKINLTTSGILLSTIGIAQENGSFGQNIRVMNADSRRELFATVVGAQEVEVKR